MFCKWMFVGKSEFLYTIHLYVCVSALLGEYDGITDNNIYVSQILSFSVREKEKENYCKVKMLFIFCQCIICANIRMIY